ncbi:MAG: hypothetical protein ALAOOOJD_03920 [bacterium]|nr:hypothetical protein [bacterium]
MLIERVAHLITRDVRRFAGFLHVHAELNHVQKELQEILILRIAALHGKSQQRFAIFERKARRQRRARPFARRDDVERILAFI